jgi:hypothetical protein
MSIFYSKLYSINNIGPFWEKIKNFLNSTFLMKFLYHFLWNCCIVYCIKCCETVFGPPLSAWAPVALWDTSQLTVNPHLQHVSSFSSSTRPSPHPLPQAAAQHRPLYASTPPRRHVLVSVRGHRLRNFVAGEVAPPWRRS